MSATFPPPPLNVIDWDNIGFKVREVNGHIESDYSVHTGKWSPPKFVKDPFLRVHGMAPGLNYGMQCYEGLKAARGPGDKTIGIFRPKSNAARMQESAAMVSIPEVPVELFTKAVNLAVSLNAEHVPPHRTGATMYIRPLLFGSCAQLGLDPPEEYKFVVFVMPTGVYHGTHPVAGLILEDFDRSAPEGTGRAKVGGNYAPVIKHSSKAKKEGFGITLHLDSATRSEIDEFSTSGFIGIYGTPNEGCTLVIPESKNVLNSVTSDSVCQIAKSWGWKVEKRPVKYDELSKFTEVAAAGTAAGLVPIKSITMRSKNDVFKYNNGSDEPGPAVVKLLTTLRGILLGTVKDEFGFLEYAREFKPDEYEHDGTSNGTTDGANDKSPNQLP